MNPEVKQLWIDALRSGDYEQGRDYLRRGDQYCCLGVLCELAVRNGVIPDPVENSRSVYLYGTAAYHLPDSVMEWAGLNDYNPEAGGEILADLNDNGFSFNHIALLIEGGL